MEDNEKDSLSFLLRIKAQNGIINRYKYFNITITCPWYIPILRTLACRKGVAYVHKVAMDLVKARRENRHSDKVRRCKILRKF